MSNVWGGGSEVSPDVAPAPVRDPSAIPLAQKVWYFDPVGGSDDNDGLTPATAIKTWTAKPDGSVGEYLSRTGFNPYLNGFYQYTLLNDLPQSDAAMILGSPGPDFLYVVQGVPKIKRSGTLTAIQGRQLIAPATTTCTGAGVAPVIGFALPHNLNNWDAVACIDFTGNTTPNISPLGNGLWTSITIIDPTHIQLNGMLGNGASTGAGYVFSMQRDEITDSGVSSWTLDEGCLVRVNTTQTLNYQGYITSGPTYGWVAKAEGDGGSLGPHRAGMSIMCGEIPTQNPYQGVWPGAFPVGSTYDVLTLPKVYGLYIDPRIESANGLNIALVSQWRFLDIKFYEPFFPPPVGTSESFTRGANFFHCSWDSLFEFGGVVTPGGAFNCFARNSFAWNGDGQIVFGLIGTFTGAGAFISGSGVLSAYGVMLQGPGIQVYGDGAGGSGNGMIWQNHHASFGLGIWDCDGTSAPPLYFGYNTSLSNESNIYGQRNKGVILALFQGGSAVDNNAWPVNRPYIRSTSGTDFSLNGKLSMFVVDDTTGVQSTVPILCTFSNLCTPCSSGGFGGTAADNRSPSTRYEMVSSYISVHPVGISPLSGPVGTSITATGWNFSKLTNIRVGGVSVTWVTNSDLSVTFNAPARAPGVYNIDFYGPAFSNTPVTLTGVWTET